MGCHPSHFMKFVTNPQDSLESFFSTIPLETLKKLFLLITDLPSVGDTTKSYFQIEPFRSCKTVIAAYCSFRTRGTGCVIDSFNRSWIAC